MGLVLGNVDKKGNNHGCFIIYVLSDSVKGAIRQKDKSCYVELATETNIYFISSDVWLKTDWVSELDHSLDTRVCVGYRNVLFVNQMYRFFS